MLRAIGYGPKLPALVEQQGGAADGLTRPVELDRGRDYGFFNHGVDIFAANAFAVPSGLPAGSLHDLLSLFLDKTHGKGGILHVVNHIGGSSTIANPDIPVTVVSYSPNV